MIHVYIEITAKFPFSFNEISLIRGSVNNSNSYRFGFWQMSFKENIFNVIREEILLLKTQVVSNIPGNPTSASISVTM